VISWLLVALSFVAQSAVPQTSPAFDVTIAPGANYDKAEFRLWLPPNADKVRAIVVLVPGSNGDGRPMAADKFWQDFAVAQKVALLACRFTDKQHDQAFIEEYVNVSKGSGDALLAAIARFAEQSHHPELINSQLLMWGMSAGGEFNYEFVGWKPEKVAAFIVNKGGIYYSSLLSKASRAVPGILFTGDADLDSRQFTVKGLFGVNRRSGALWALAEEPGLGHVVGSSQKLGALLFSEVLDAAPGSIAENNGYLGNIHTFEIAKRSDILATKDISSWFLTERLAKAWQDAVKK
jgi:poly(3-hydroxybutyrate) depolymerase